MVGRSPADSAPPRTQMLVPLDLARLPAAGPHRCWLCLALANSACTAHARWSVRLTAPPRAAGPRPSDGCSARLHASLWRPGPWSRSGRPRSSRLRRTALPLGSAPRPGPAPAPGRCPAVRLRLPPRLQLIHAHTPTWIRASTLARPHLRPAA
ncbi:hypothetical protein ZWY2020_053234 [Hordeum vulgare]|nr:hypothetical protein ZWY2020_053234 [Hordeum vulgare]